VRGDLVYKSAHDSVLLLQKRHQKMNRLKGLLTVFYSNGMSHL
jgi:hypothetical protein